MSSASGLILNEHILFYFILFTFYFISWTLLSRSWLLHSVQSSFLSPKSSSLGLSP